MLGIRNDSALYIRTVRLVQDASATFVSQSEGSLVLKLYDVRAFGAASLQGRVDWPILEKHFGADKVAMADDMSPSLLTSGEYHGLTRDMFANGDRVPVNVYKQSGVLLPIPPIDDLLLFTVLLVCISLLANIHRSALQSHFQQPSQAEDKRRGIRSVIL